MQAIESEPLPEKATGLGAVEVDVATSVVEVPNNYRPRSRGYVSKWGDLDSQMTQTDGVPFGFPLHQHQWKRGTFTKQHTQVKLSPGMVGMCAIEISCIGHGFLRNPSKCLNLLLQAPGCLKRGDGFGVKCDSEISE